MSAYSKDLVGEIFKKCAGTSGCEVCKLHMNEDCLFFPELYRLNDELIDEGKLIDTKAIFQLLDLCTFCGLCPCTDVRMLILQAKAAFKDENGTSLSATLIADAQRLGKLGTLLNRCFNKINSTDISASIVKKAAGIHPDRQLPMFPDQNFFQWAKNNGDHFIKRGSINTEQKVAYFAGCSAGYFFPEVGKATVSFLKSIGIEVVIPEQECCGMPLLMEGQKQKAFAKIKTNMNTLLRAVREGYKVVCSCPTCGYFYKKLLLEKAYFSNEAQERLDANNTIMKAPIGSGTDKFISLPKTTYQKILKDDGYFSSINSIDRIALSQAVCDLGEFIFSYQKEHLLTFKTSNTEMPLIYFPPCHQREQQIGTPYYQLLASMTNTNIIQVGGALDCCGMGGHLGYKKSFHKLSLKAGQSLFKKLESEKDRTIVTECLSCKLQFSQVLNRKVFHPIELIQI